jgi:hypothetical protein
MRFPHGFLWGAQTAPTQVDLPSDDNDCFFGTNTGKRRDRNRFRDRILCRAVDRANADRAKSGLRALPPITPHPLRRTWATLAAIAGRHPKWIAAQIGHTNPVLTFQVYEQVATRRYLDEEAVWNVMRFADEPEQRAPSRQLTRTVNGQLAPKTRRRRIVRRVCGRVNPSICRQLLMGTAGFEPATSRV